MAFAKSIPFPAPTSRFKRVVQRCGPPSVQLTFVAAKKDVGLQRLERAKRVMTVHRAGRGKGSDYGLVGLLEERGAQLLVFPKSLRPFIGRRVVGIDYSLLTSTAKTTGNTATVQARRKAAAPPSKPQKPPALPRPPPEKTSTPLVKPTPVVPPSMGQVLKKLDAINRRLAAGRYSLARTETSQLADSIRSGLKNASKSSSVTRNQAPRSRC